MTDDVLFISGYDHKFNNHEFKTIMCNGEIYIPLYDISKIHDIRMDNLTTRFINHIENFTELTDYINFKCGDLTSRHKYILKYLPQHELKTWTRSKYCHVLSLQGYEKLVNLFKRNKVKETFNQIINLINNDRKDQDLQLQRLSSQQSDFCFIT